MSDGQRPQQQRPDADKQSQINQVALAIYTDMLSGRYRGRSPDFVAQQAFAAAMPFLKAAEHVAKNGAPPESAPHKAPLVKVKRWEFDAKRNAYVPALDERTKQPLYDEVLGDLDAFCPNQSIEHPTNQRHKLAREHYGLAPAWGDTPPSEYPYAASPVN